VQGAAFRENKLDEASPILPPPFVDPALLAILEKHRMVVTPEFILDLQQWKAAPFDNKEAPPSYWDL